ncbi:ferritin heavy chain-like [Glossophaga mutica]
MEMAFTPRQLRHIHYRDCEAAITNQVNLELHASNVYKSMSCYFDRGDMAFKPFSTFFLRQSNKEREHAEYLLGLQNQRGGTPGLCNIPRPEEEHWENALRVLECALHLAKRVRQSLLSLQQPATEKHSRVCLFEERDYLHEQGMFIQELEDQITNLRKLEAPEDSWAKSLLEKLSLRIAGRTEPELPSP